MLLLGFFPFGEEFTFSWQSWNWPAKDLLFIYRRLTDGFDFHHFHSAESIRSWILQDQSKCLLSCLYDQIIANSVISEPFIRRFRHRVAQPLIISRRHFLLSTSSPEYRPNPSGARTFSSFLMTWFFRACASSSTYPSRDCKRHWLKGSTDRTFNPSHASSPTLCVASTCCTSSRELQVDCKGYQDLFALNGVTYILFVAEGYCGYW